MTLADVDLDSIERLLKYYDLQFKLIDDGLPIPGSYWGEPEAGIISSTVYARLDTPVHSVLHEACHLIVLPREQRALVHTDATDSVLEEDAVCYLQITLAQFLDDVGSKRLMQDMDSWGYTFRLGSAQRWYDEDAEDAKKWLTDHRIDSSPHL